MTTWLVVAAPAFGEVASGAVERPASPTRGPEELLREGAALAAAGDFEGAAELAEGAVGVAPESAAAWALLGRARVLARRYVTAEPALERAVALAPEDLRSRLYLAAAYWENGRLDEAEGAFRAALERSGGGFVPLYQLGRLLLWRGAAAEAAQVLARAAAIEPGAADVALDLARALERSGDLEAARGAFWRAVELAPSDALARYGLARLLARLGERQTAAREMEVYRKLYEADQERVRREGLAQAGLDLGRELLRTGRPREAVAHLTALPASADALAVLALAHRAAGDRAAALDAIERAVGLAPAREDLRARLAEMRLEERERE